MKIFDCFKFFNEVELLNLRFLEYYDIVDYFVLVESTLSHTGKPKELFFQQNQDRYTQYLDKVIHVVVDDLPMYDINDIWKAENYQRNCIQRGLDEVASLGDLVIISDADEIWDKDTMLANKHQKAPITFMQHLFYYWVNCVQNHIWAGPCMAPYGTFNCPQDLRNFSRETAGNPVYPGGWHYSFMGGAERIKTKVENIAESHLIIEQVGDIDQITTRMNNVEDLWGRTEEMAQKQIVDISSYHPQSLDKFLQLYPDFIYEKQH